MKSRAILWLMLSTAIILAGCSNKDVTTTGPGLTPSGTQISGDQTGTLSAANSPYWVTGDLTVPQGQTLTIEPGVELRFGGLFKFMVKGHLQAVGNADNNIVFTSMPAALGSPDRGQWRAIIFDSGNDTSEMAYCQIKYGAVWDSTQRYPGHINDTTGQWVNDLDGIWINGAIFCWNSSPIIRKCSVLINGYHGIYCIGLNSRPRLLDDNIIENDGDGVRCEPEPGDPFTLNAQPVIHYTNSFENNARQWADCPEGIGERLTVNANGDSCDLNFNFSMSPMYEDQWTQLYNLDPCSPCISAASDGGAIGSIPYYIGATELRGAIGGRVLTAAANPWYVSCNVFVPDGQVLTIEPGALVLFNDTYSMRVEGTLLADGAVFKPLDSTNVQAKWMGLIFEGAEASSYIRNSRFEKGSSTVIEPPFAGVITVKNCAPEISGNTFTGSEWAAISCLNQAQPTIELNVIDGFGPVGINCYNNSHPLIRHNRILNGIGYGILCSFHSSPTIESNLVYGTDFWGIKCENESSPIIQYNTISANAYGGIIVAETSDPQIAQNIVAFNYSGTPTNGHGCNLQVWGSSSPVVSYNDFHQPDPAFTLYSGFTPDATNITSNPLFVNAAAGDFHLQAGSPAATAGPSGGEIGAYGLGNW
jgi:parallel beta-helix repeat protein